MPTLTANFYPWRIRLALIFGVLFALANAHIAQAQDIWYVDDDSDEGLVAYFKFDEGEGTVTHAFPNLAITATLESGLAFTTSVPPDFEQPNFHALDLDGSDDQASILDNSALNLLDTFSLVVWIKRSADDIDTASVIYDSGDTGARWYVGFLDNNVLTFTANNVQDSQSAHTVDDTDWHHVAFVKDGDGSNNLTVYLDGSPDAIDVSLATLPSGLKRIGNKQSGGSTPFGGQLDELRLYDRALSQAEVQRLALIGCALAGTDWPNAFSDLQCGLASAVSGDEIWTAEGLYRPGINVAASFVLTDNVRLFGGFATTETVRSQRNWETNLTVLNGDVDDNDGTDANGVITDTFAINGDNAYHVVTSNGVTVTAQLDGFVITGGDADNPSAGDLPNDQGGGIVDVGGSPVLANLDIVGNFGLDGGGMATSGTPTLTNITFRNNRASTLGGGIFNAGGNPSLQDVLFRGNIAEDSGGGMANLDSSAILTQVTFIENIAEDNGGGMDNRNSNPRLTDVTFRDNVAETNGGGMMNDNGSHATVVNALFSGNYGEDEGGGMVNNNGSNPLLLNVIFEGNYSEDGGGLSNLAASPTLINVLFAGNRAIADGGGLRNLTNANPLLINVTFSGNQGFDGGGMDNINSDPFIQNAIFWHNEATNGPSIESDNNSSPTVRFSIIEGGIPANTVDGGNNLDTDPLFVQLVDCGGDGLCADDLASPFVDESTDDDYGDLRLLPASPAIDIGDNSAVPVTVTTDLAGQPRIVAVRIVTPTVDLGAYEMPNSPPVFVSSPPLTATANVTYTYLISTTDPNVDDNRTLSASVIPTWLNLTNNGDGTGTLNGAPAVEDVGAHAVTLQVQDSGGLTDTQSFTVTVFNLDTDDNDAPTFTSTPITLAVQGSPYTYTISTSDPDVGDSRTLSAPVIPAWLSLTDNGDGTGTLQGTPALEDVGAHAITLQVQDSGGLTDTQSFIVAVANINTGGNDAPSFTSTPIINAVQGTPYTYTISTTDPDVGDSRTLSATIKPAWLTLTDNGDGTGILGGTPALEDVGAHAVTLQVQDSGGLTNTQSFTVTVNATTGGIAGRILEDSTGVPGVTVSVNDVATNTVSVAAVIAQDVTDAQGNYSFSGLAPGPYTLTFAPPSGFVTPNPVNVIVESEQTTAVPTIFLDRAPTDDEHRLFLPSIHR